MEVNFNEMDTVPLTATFKTDAFQDVDPTDIKKIVEIKTYNAEAEAQAYNESAGLVASNWFEENKNLLLYAAIGLVAWKLLK